MKRIIDELKRNGYEAETREVYKNGIKRNTLLVKLNDNISVTFYEEQLRDMTVGDVIKAIRENTVPDINIDTIFTEENLYRNARIGLQRKSDEKIVKEDFHGYDKYLYMIIGESDNGTQTAKINYSIISTTGVDLERLWKAAEENTYDETEINDFIFMKYMTNKSKIKGAGVITTEKGIADAKNAVGSKRVLVIPSSIHEVIIMPYDNTIDLNDIRKMIKEVNETEVAENDILGYEPIIL